MSSLVRVWLPDHAIFFDLQLLSLDGNTDESGVSNRLLTKYTCFYNFNFLRNFQDIRLQTFKAHCH